MVGTIKTTGTFSDIRATKGLKNLTVGIKDKTADGIIAKVLPYLVGINVSPVQSTLEIYSNMQTKEIWKTGVTSVEGDLTVTDINNEVRVDLYNYELDEETGAVFAGDETITPEISLTYDKYDNEGRLNVVGLVAVTLDNPSESIEKSSKELAHNNTTIALNGRAVTVGGKSYTWLFLEDADEETAGRFREFVHTLRLKEDDEAETAAAVAKMFNQTP